MNPDRPLVQVALPLPIDEPLTYLWPESALSPPAVGLRVLVPLGKRRVTGYVVEANSSPPAPTGESRKTYAFKSVFSVLDDEPLFGPRELQFYQWIARYYLASVGEVLRTALPGSMNVRSFRAVRILPQGMLALKHGLFLTGHEADILGHVGQGGRMTVQALQQKVGRTVEGGLDSLEKKGFIEGCQLLRGKQASSAAEHGLIRLSLPESSPPLEEWVSLLPKAEARIVEHLNREGPCSAKALRKTLPRTGKALQDLT